MAVAHDAFSESHAGTTGSVSEASFTWDHTPAGTPRGVLVFTTVTGATNDDATSVTYGGSALTAVTGGRAVDTTGEPCDCKAWFLGSSVPTGTQAVVVNRTNNADVMWAGCVTVTALTDTEVTGVVLLEEQQTQTEQNVDDGTPGTNSMRYAGMASGIPTWNPNGANSTALGDIDYGANGAGVVRETTAGQGSRPVGFNTGVTDDTACVHLAIREVVAAGSAWGGHLPERWCRIVPAA